MLKDLKTWANSELVKAMVYGGLGIQGISQTQFYSFISSKQGLSELGIDASNPPKLLEAYEKTIRVSISNDQIDIEFGDTDRLRMMTPHPAAGIKNLAVESWMDWILDEQIVDKGFVSRDKLPDRLDQYIRLTNPLGGLMLKQGAFGSTGQWRFPTSLMNYDEQWVDDNKANIRKAILNKVSSLLQERLS